MSHESPMADIPLADLSAGKPGVELSLRQRALAINFSGLLLLMLLSIAVCSAYVSRERCFYSWDYAAYHQESVHQALAYRASPVTGLKNLARSTAYDYPYTYCQPLVPFLLVFGSSRMAYEIGLTLLYQVPFFLIMGAIATRFIDRAGRAVLWSSAFLIFFFPLAWAPMLRGYPDVGAAALYAFAVWLYLRDMQLRKWRQIVAIGLCLGFCPLFRRHFGYDVIAFFLAIGLQTAFVMVRNMKEDSRKACRDAFAKGLRLGMIGLVFLGLILTVGHKFVRHALETNPTILYASYMRPPAEVLKSFIHSYGLATLFLAAVGYVAGFIKFPHARSAIVFLPWLAAFTAVIWIFDVRQLGVHYTLHIAILVYPGVILLFWAAWRSFRPAWRIPVFAFAGAMLLLNFSLGLSNRPWADNKPWIRSLVAAKHPPQQRADYEEIVRLVDYLRQNAANAPIAVNGSSEWMNEDLLRQAEWQVYGENRAKLHITYCPQIDSRDSYPLESLLNAQYVVLTQPLRYHLPPDQQKVVRVVGDAFAENWPIAGDFERLPEKFSLDSGITATVCKRIRPTSTATAIDALTKMVTRVGARPGTQDDWFFLTGQSPAHEKMQYYSQIGFTDKEPAAPSLMSLDTVPDRGVVQGNLKFLDQRRAGARVFLAAIDADGKKTPLGETTLGPLADTQKFLFSYAAGGKMRLLLTIAALDDKPSAKDCGPIFVSDLRVLADRSSR
jgi:hypothetical protein